MSETITAISEPVQCPVDRCKSIVPRAKLVRGVCPKCADTFRTEHGRILDPDYNPQKVYETVEHKKRPTHFDKEGCHFDANGDRVELTHDSESGEGWLIHLCQRHGISLTAAMEIVADCANHFGQSHGGEEKGRELFQRINAGLAWLIEYTGDPKMAARCLAFTLGFMDVAGCVKGTAVEVAVACSTDEHRVRKATVNKCLRSLESCLNGLVQYKKLPPLPGQRSDGARENMRQATKQNWEKAAA